MEKDKSGKFFSLDLSRENGKIKISACETADRKPKTLRHYEFKDCADHEIDKLCADVVDLLNRSNRRGNIDHRTLKDLRTAGQLFYDCLLTNNIKKKLSEADTDHLVISIDERLVHIPWELLYDGESFLCQKFNMGRIVSTSQRVSEPAVRKISRPLKMLVIADPRGDLDAAYNEGVKLRDELDSIREAVEVDMRSSLVEVKSLKGILRSYDIVHYAGHADYDARTPSQSGFLLGDGKLSASDIINMIGTLPLPFLVFSNACKSGHSDMWKVEGEFETEIYGLANAFLLSGVRHYIGTFWDVQDEAGLHFALAFYRELIQGAMVGEAVRKARLYLIERYGEMSVIWASYMLYGDPTVRYIDSSPHGKSDIKEEIIGIGDTGQVAGKTFRGNVGKSGGVRNFPTQRRQQIFTFGLLFLFFCAALVTGLSFFYYDRDEDPYRNAPSEKRESPEAKGERIDKLVATLIKNYNAREPSEQKDHIGLDKKGLLTLVFINIRTNGINEFDKEFFFNRVTSNLQTTKRMQVIEREILDKLLEELNLSTTELADPARALEIGKILSAQIISTGSLSRDGNDWRLSLRFIETATTSIKAALTANFTAKDMNTAAEMVSRNIVEEIRTEYPLRGKLISLKKDKVVVNIGAEDGVTEGMKLNVLSEVNGSMLKMGILEIISTGATTSTAKINVMYDELKEGFTVEELI